MATEAKAGVIRDQGYQRYTGERRTGSRAGLIIARVMKMTARQPWVLAMLIVAIFPALIWSVVMYGTAKMHAMTVAQLVALGGEASQASGPNPDELVFLFGMKPYGALLVGFLTAMFAGSGAIADDIRGNASQFYFARPVERRDYMIGKLLPTLILTVLVVGAPMVLLSVIRCVFAADASDLWQGLKLIGRSLAFGGIEAAALGVPVLALSSLTRHRGYVQGLTAAGFALPWIVGAIFSSVMRSPWPNVLSLPAHLASIGQFLFALPVEPDDRLLPVWVSAPTLAALLIGALVVLRTRLGKMELL